MRGLCCCAGSSLVVVGRLLIVVASLIVEHRFEGIWASVVAVPGLWSTASGVVMHWFSCSAARGIFLSQGLNPCLLYWQTESSSLSH